MQNLFPQIWIPPLHHPKIPILKILTMHDQFLLTIVSQLIGYTSFSKFYGKVGVISWLLFHLIWKNYVLYWDFDSKSWIVDFFTRFTHEKTPQNNFSCQNFSVENNYCGVFSRVKWVKKKIHISTFGVKISV